MRPVYLERAGLRPITDAGKVLSVPCNIEAEPVIHAALVAGTDRYGQIHASSFDAAQTGLAVDQHIMIVDQNAAISLQLTHRILAEMSVSDTELPRHRHLTHKTQILDPAGRSLPVLHPGDHHAPAILCQQRLRCIKIKTVVDRLHILAQKMVHPAVKTPDQADIAIAGMKLQTDSIHILRADQ